jgi:light-harvesting complex 1 beta chain
MAASISTKPPVPSRDTSAPRLVFWVAFAALLVIAFVGQVIAADWRQWLPGAESERSLIGGVKSAVYTLMSNIP